MAHIYKHHNNEVEQGVIRIIITLSMLIYMILIKTQDVEETPQWRNGMTGLLVFSVFSVAQLAALVRYPKYIKWSRIVGVLADTTAVSIAILVVAELAIPYWWVYLWITVGNGFRYGVGMLCVTACLSIIGFWIVYQIHPYWSQHEQFWYGMMLCLIVIPGYVAVLLLRLQTQTRRAEEGSRAKTLFLANVSHELRTPLQSIILQTQLLVREQDKRRIGDGLKSVMRSANQMLDLVTQLLDLAKSETTEKINIIYENMNVRSFLDETLEMINPTLRGDNMLLLRYDGDPETIVCNATRLRQMIVNLVQNADKFTHAGTIEIALSRDGNSENMLLSVCDTGCGMAPEVRKRIFEAFYQDATRDHDGQGIGIGLWVTHSIVHAFGGSIKVESTPGVGTRFEIRIPLAQKRVIEASQSPVGQLSHYDKCRGLYILYAEDDRHIRWSMMIFLRESVIKVDECHNGQMAAECIRERGEEYDAIVLDNRMPGVIGSVLLKQIREEQSLEVPVILLTGDENDDLVKLCQEHNAIMLYKPIQPQILIDTLRKVVASNDHAPQGAEPVRASWVDQERDKPRSGRRMSTAGSVTERKPLSQSS